MGKLMVTLLYLLVILGLASSKPTGGSYESRVRQWETDFHNMQTISCEAGTDNAADIIRTAYDKKYPSTLDNTDDLAAARIVNMFTQRSCLYKVVNEGLRQNRLSNTLREYSSLLNEAIDLLSEELNDGCSEFKTYRGTNECDEITGVGRATHKSFTSTSTDPKVPFNFNCNIYISYKSVQGLFVSELSDFEKENEVLLKTNYQIDVTEYITDENEIVKKMKDISANFADNEIQKVKKFVRATSVISTSDEALVCNRAVPARHLMLHTLILCLIPLMTTYMD